MAITHYLKPGTPLVNCKYIIEKTLGSGSFGITYLAKTKLTFQGNLGPIEVEAKVCIKEFFMSEVNTRKNDGSSVEGSTGKIFTNYRNKFKKEALNLSELSHPNIVKVTDVFDENNTTYYVMEFIEGVDLNDYIKLKGGLDEKESISILNEVGCALSYMHSKNILHLDIKPKNIMRRHDGTYFLIDFGLSKQFSEGGEPESSTTIGGGTPGYAPLEQSTYKPDKSFPATLDVYALGATLFKMLTGKRPPEATYILNEGFPFRSLQLKGVSEQTVNSITKAMAPQKKARFQKVEDFLEDLNGEEIVPIAEGMKRQEEFLPVRDTQNEAIMSEEAADWSKAERYRTIEGYELYKQKWTAPEYVEYAQHLGDAVARIDYLERQRMLPGLLKDMRENPWRYRQDLLRILFTGILTHDMCQYNLEIDFEQPYADFVLSGNKLKMSDLSKAGVIPEHITKEEILAPDYPLPVTTLKDLGELPIDRTDVYFLGVQRTGKTSVIASIAYKLSHDQPHAYIPHIVNGVDVSTQYYNGLVKSIESNKAPCGTERNSISCIKVDLARENSRKKTLLNLVDISGEALKEISDRYVRPSEMWDELGASQCIANNNRKVLFFVLDYSIISDMNPENTTTPTRQILALETALRVFREDGPDVTKRYKGWFMPTIGCTMSKVDTVAVIMTKCDLMNVNSHQERLDLAMQYINENFRFFMDKLIEVCKIIGINKSNNYRPYIMAYSLGKFYVGNTCIINEEDPANLINFLANVTPKNQSSKWWKF